MTTLRFRVLSVVFFLASTMAFAGPLGDYEKKIIDQFAISSDGEVEIQNRYGKVELETWSENQVKIEVTIIVEAKSQSKADEVFERIGVNFSNTTSYVRAATDINSGNNWNKWFGNSSNKFEINYHVWLPSTVNIDLTNKYGDIVVPNMNGDAQIELKYGNFRMDAISGEVDIDLGYGKGSITSGGDANLDLKYCTLHGGDFGDVNANTKYSTVEFGNVGVMVTNSAYDAYRVASATSFTNVGKYDDFDIGETESVIMTTKYTHLDIAKLTDAADLNFTHGGVKIKNLASGFSNVNMNGDYTNLIITTDPSATFQFDIKGRHTSIKHDNVEVYHDIQNNSSNSEVKGYRGSRDAGSVIAANMSYGTVKIN